jgi:2-oxoisovalerate dehydrogenase E1 component beta subunit
MAGELTAVINEEAFEYLDGPVVRVTSIDTPVPYAPPLEQFFMPQVEDVLKAVRALAAY